jgi:hypothetical protein
MLKNGTVFDTTHGSAEPFVFVIGINQVIKGFFGKKFEAINVVNIMQYIWYGI